MARSSYFSTIARRARAAEPQLQPPRSPARGWHGAWPSELPVASVVDAPASGPVPTPPPAAVESVAAQAVSETDSVAALAAEPAPAVSERARSDREAPLPRPVTLTQNGRTDAAQQAVRAPATLDARSPTVSLQPRQAQPSLGANRVPPAPLTALEPAPFGSQSMRAELYESSTAYAEPNALPSEQPAPRQRPPQPAPRAAPALRPQPALSFGDALQVAFAWVADAQSAHPKPHAVNATHDMRTDTTAAEVAPVATGDLRGSQTAPLAPLPPNPRGRTPPASPAVDTPRTLHIGSIEVQIHPEPRPRAVDSPAPRASEKPSSLTRGFSHVFGLRQS